MNEFTKVIVESDIDINSDERTCSKMWKKLSKKKITVKMNNQTTFKNDHMRLLSLSQIQRCCCTVRNFLYKSTCIDIYKH